MVTEILLFIVAEQFFPLALTQICLIFTCNVLFEFSREKLMKQRRNKRA